MADSEFEPRQICIAHQELWEAIEEWADHHGVQLSEFPHDPGDLRNFCFTPKRAATR